MPSAFSNMVIGVLQFDLIIHDAQSLKDKRRVVQSLKDRLHREHMVSIAEVGSHDARGKAVLGLVCAAPDTRRAADVLDAITNKLLALMDAELGRMHREILTAQEPIP